MKNRKLKIAGLLIRQLSLFILAGLILASTAASSDKAKVSEKQLRSHVEYLASPELAGRAAPEPGSELAQKYVAAHFKEYGLKELPGAPGYMQSVPLIVSRTDYERSRLTINAGGKITEFIPDKEVFFFPRGGKDSDLTAGVLLAGYGIRAPEFSYDDFASADPKGKFLLIFNREPQEKDTASIFNGAKPTKYSQPQVKVRIAREMGALGVLIIQPPNNGLPPIESTLDRYRKTQNDPLIQLAEERDAFPVFYLTNNAAGALLGGFDLSAYQKGIDEKLTGDPRLLNGIEVTLNIRFKETQETTTANVVSYYPGQTDEAVLVLAHHDHIGMSDGVLNPGADDNASGTAGLLEMARLFSQSKEKLRRGVIFLSTGAEEVGTLGALYFSKHLPIPAEKIAAALNMDCIGRDASTQFRAMQDSILGPEPNTLMIFYSGQTPVLDSLAQKVNEITKLNLIMEPSLHFSGSSDHIHFHDLRIPSMFFFTGFHRDYHTPEDVPNKLNYEKMTRVVMLGYGILADLAQISQRPVFDTTIKEVKGTGRKYGG
jgi:hypothetical protein